LASRCRRIYDVQDPNWRPDNTKLRAVFETDADGRFSFWTVMPKSYPIPTDDRLVK